MAWPPPTIQAPPEGDRSPEESPEHGEPAAPAPVTGAYDAAGMQALPDAPGPGWLSRPERLVGSVLGGRYRVTAVLGLGPMGIACEGESPRGRQVTLKVIPKPAELSAERFAWLVREALALAHFDHPHVVPSTDFGSLEDGSAFISRSRVPGAPLRSLLLRQGALPLRRALSIAQQIADALAAAHAQDICHGRLKPENVILQGTSAAGDLVRVVDFGLSRLPLGAAASAVREARQLELRSRMYLPSADLVGAAQASSLALDVYSLAVLLFEMIAGRLPFAPEEAGFARSPGALIGFPQGASPVLVPPAVEDLVMQMLLAPTDTSSAYVLAALDALLGRPSVAPVTPPPDPVTSTHQSLLSASLREELPAPLVQDRAALLPDSPFRGSVLPDSPFPDPAFRRSLLPGSVLPGSVLPGSFPPARESVPALRNSRLPSLPPLPPGYDGSLPRTSASTPMISTAEGLLSESIPPEAHAPLSPFPPTVAASLSPFPPAVSSASFPPPLGMSAALEDVSLSAEDEAELRPSLLTRLRRLFTRAKPTDF